MAHSFYTKTSVLDYVLVNGGTQVCRALFLKRKNDLKPPREVAENWTVGKFLSTKRRAILTTESGRKLKRYIFPEGTTHDSIETWDITILVCVLKAACDVGPITECHLKALGKMRNKLCHRSDKNAIDDEKYDRYYNKMKALIEELLKDINDESLNQSITEMFEKVENEKIDDNELTKAVQTLEEMVTRHEEETRTFVESQHKETRHIFQKDNEEIKSLLRQLISAIQTQKGSEVEDKTESVVKIGLRPKHCTGNTEQNLSRVIAEAFNEEINPSQSGESLMKKYCTDLLQSLNEEIENDSQLEELQNDVSHKIREAVLKAIQKLQNAGYIVVKAEHNCILLHIRCRSPVAALVLYEQYNNGKLDLFFDDLRETIQSVEKMKGLTLETEAYAEELIDLLNTPDLIELATRSSSSNQNQSVTENAEQNDSQAVSIPTKSTSLILTVKTSSEGNEEGLKRQLQADEGNVLKEVAVDFDSLLQSFIGRPDRDASEKSCNATTRAHPGHESCESPVSERAEETKTLRSSHQKMAKEHPKIFNDPVHGEIELHPLLVRIINTAEFQRLRFIKQLGGVYFVYPGAAHNRFEHSIGVCHLAGEFARKLKKRQEEDEKCSPKSKITETDILCVEIAALCHDLGHGPFSNLFEKMVIPEICEKDEAKEFCQHEELSIAMFERMYGRNKLKTKFEDAGLLQDSEFDDIVFIKELITRTKEVKVYRGRPREKHFLYEIMSNTISEIDVNTWDYLARDCLMLGLKSFFSHTRAMNCALVRETEEGMHICYREKEAKDLYDMFSVKNMIHHKACQHRVVVVVEIMIADAIIAATKSNHKDFLFRGTDGVLCTVGQALKDMAAYQQITDEILMKIHYAEVSNETGQTQNVDKGKFDKAKQLVKRILERDLYMCVGSKLFQGTEMYRGSSTYSDLKEKVKNEMNKIVDMGNFERKQELKDSIVVYPAAFKYGQGEKNPLECVWFCTKQSDAPERLSKEEISNFLPDIFYELRIMVYCKELDYLSDVKRVFGHWQKTKDLEKKKRHLEKKTLKIKEEEKEIREMEEQLQKQLRQIEKDENKRK